MRLRPTGPKYRNLIVRGGIIYYQRCVRQRRVRFSCKADDWQLAAEIARLYEQRTGIARLAVPVLPVTAPRLSEFAARYLEEDTTHLAPTTLRDRRGYLAPEGRLNFQWNQTIDGRA